MYFHNDTEAFMKQKFQPEDYKFIRKMARELESQGLEAKRKKDLVQHMQAKNEKRRAVQEMRKQNAAKRAGRIEAVKVIVDKENIKDLKGEKLKDCLLAYKLWGAPIPEGITVRSKVGAISVETAGYCLRHERRTTVLNLLYVPHYVRNVAV